VAPLGAVPVTPQLFYISWSPSPCFMHPRLCAWFPFLAYYITPDTPSRTSFSVHFPLNFLGFGSLFFIASVQHYLQCSPAIRFSHLFWHIPIQSLFVNSSW
jgi:hypothetical protein